MEGELISSVHRTFGATRYAYMHECLVQRNLYIKDLEDANWPLVDTSTILPSLLSERVILLLLENRSTGMTIVEAIRRSWTNAVR